MGWVRRECEGVFLDYCTLQIDFVLVCRFCMGYATNAV